MKLHLDSCLQLHPRARAVDLLRSHGAEVEKTDLPAEFDNVPEGYRIGLNTERGLQR